MYVHVIYDLLNKSQALQHMAAAASIGVLECIFNAFISKKTLKSAAFWKEWSEEWGFISSRSFWKDVMNKHTSKLSTSNQVQSTFSIS